MAPVPDAEDWRPLPKAVTDPSRAQRAEARAAAAERKAEEAARRHRDDLAELLAAHKRQVEAIERYRDEAFADHQKKVRAFEDLLGSIELYISWPYVTKQLTTEEKELFADAVDASAERLNEGNGPDEKARQALRWWRDDAQATT